MSVQSKIAKQTTEIARLTQALERAEETKRDTMCSGCGKS